MRRIKSKKGAIELSMSTIIVIILGVTLLVLGLTWISSIFGSIDELTSSQFASAQKMILEQMGNNEKFYVSGLSFDVESGKKLTINVGVQNFGNIGETNKFKLEITAGEGGDAKWFTLPPEQEIAIGDKKGLPVVLTIPKGVTPGSSFSFTIKALKDNQFYDSDSIIVTVK
ncbi:MAG: hypothetical protein KJ623_02130 [Nanoarchaeota archaeon]|nr:hypothetical protein [Nanoarchaeota archaeon]MBU0962777.1 hypothetical protein [Nanoarchaeota archaeon]